MSEPKLDGWRKVSTSLGPSGRPYGLYVSPDGKQVGEKDEADGETAIIFDRATKIISYVHPNTVKGAAMVGLTLEVGMNYYEAIEKLLRNKH